MDVQRRTPRRTFSEGERHGGLTYVREAGFSGGKKQARLVLCRCDCGTEVTVRMVNWLSGNTTSCGRHRGTHYLTGTPFYKCYTNMRIRAKKVGVDPRWTTFDGFAANPPTAGPSPIDGIERTYEPGLCLCRTGDAGAYTPENCRWDTRRNNSTEQQTSQLRLTNQEVREIRARYAFGGVLQRELGAQYGVTQVHIHNIVCNNYRRDA